MDLPRQKVYVAGPISKGDLTHNIQQAIEAGVELIKAGFAPWIPQLTAMVPQFTAIPHPGWMEVDLPWVREADALLRLPGESYGADLEVSCAKESKIPVYFSVKELIDNPPARGDKLYLDQLAEMKALHKLKAADYGTKEDLFANIRASEKFKIPAWLGAVLRAGDKWQRIQAFVVNESLKNESFEDSLQDMAAYLLIALRLRRELLEKANGPAADSNNGASPANSTTAA